MEEAIRVRHCFQTSSCCYLYLVIGMLAGFARLKFPNLFFASVSSSSPMQAQVFIPYCIVDQILTCMGCVCLIKVDMVGYNDVVANSMTVTSVGGSEECLAVVVEV